MLTRNALTRSGRLARLVGAAALIAAASVGAAGTPAEAASAVTGSFIFHKNAKDPTNSKLEWRVVNNSTKKVVRSVNWRAGSGLGSTDECAGSRGWLPNGRYGVTFHPTHNGAQVKGVAFQLDNKTCRSGRTTRSDLLIHSEMTASGGQNSKVESQRWDGNGDYKSYGCIKLKPADVKAAAAEFKKYYAAERYYSGMLTVGN